MGNRYPPPSYRGPYQPPPPPTPDPFGGDERKELIAGLMMPKSVVSVAIWVLMFGLGAGLAGLALFILYQTQVNDIERRMIDSQEELEEKFNQRLEELEQRPAPEATATLNVAAEQAERLRNELLRSVAPAIVGIQGVDSSGAGASGSGFVVNTTGDGSWIVTNYQLVAGTRSESGVTVRLGQSQLYGTLYETDPGSDLALVIINVSGRKSLRFSRGELKPGDPVWVFSTARGNPYATVIDAHLVDYSPARVTIDVDPPPQFNGGPVVDAQGRVVGILSSRPATASTRSVEPSPEASPATVRRAATPIRNVCNVILRCPGSRPNTSASPSPGTTPAAAPPAAAQQQAAPSPQPPAPPAPSPAPPLQPIADPANPFFQNPAAN